MIAEPEFDTGVEVGAGTYFGAVVGVGVGAGTYFGAVVGVGVAT